MFLLWWFPFKIWKEKRADLQFTNTDYLIIVLTPVRIRWTIPLKTNDRYGHVNVNLQAIVAPLYCTFLLTEKKKLQSYVCQNLQPLGRFLLSTYMNGMYVSLFTTGGKKIIVRWMLMFVNTRSIFAIIENVKLFNLRLPFNI